jgi:hypothetical protein
LENLYEDVDINVALAWENITENTKTSATGTLGYHQLKTA